MNIRIKEEKGITLIALIVTIIVLLILAMVSVNLILRDNLILKAQSAKEEYESAAQKEARALDEFEAEVNKHIPTTDNEDTTQWLYLETGREQYVCYNGNSTTLTLSSSTVNAEKITSDGSTVNKTGEINEIDLNNSDIIYLFNIDAAMGGAEAIGPEIINLNGKIPAAVGNVIWPQNVKEIKGLDGWTATSKEKFSDYIYLEKIELPSSLIEIGSECFKNCISLKSIEIPNNVTNIQGGVFDGCTNLKTIRVNRTLSDAEATLGIYWMPSGATVTYNDQSKTY